jgi:hypothetical protein
MERRRILLSRRILALSYGVRTCERPNWGCEVLAELLGNKGAALNELERSEEAIAIYGDMRARFGVTSNGRCANRSSGRLSMAGNLDELGPSEGAIATPSTACSHVLARPRKVH